MAGLEVRLALVAAFVAGSATAQLTTTQPQLGTRLQARIEATVAKTRPKISGGLWNRWLVIGGIDGNSEGLWYYTADAAKYGTPDAGTAFHVGSLTKVVTATLLALQEGRGMTVGPCGVKTLHKTKLADVVPVTLHGQRKDITIEQLATHHSGLPRHLTVKACNSTELFAALSSFDLTPASPPGCIAGERPQDSGDEKNCDSAHPCFPPGQKYVYSSWAYYTLGPLLAINARYGVGGYNNLARDEFFTPYGMRQTFGGDEDVPANTTKAPDWVCSYSFGPANERYLTCNRHNNPDTRHAGFEQHGSGHLWSTGPDILKLLRFAMGRPPLARESKRAKAMDDARKLMFCDRRDGEKNDDGTMGKMGLGWNHNKLGSTWIWWKAGHAGEFHSYIAFAPSKNVGVFVLGNADVDEPKEIGKAFLGDY